MVVVVVVVGVCVVGREGSSLGHSNPNRVQFRP